LIYKKMSLQSVAYSFSSITPPKQIGLLPAVSRSARCIA